ncbi:trans-aconitate 2-methyltransferase [Tistrella mobilis]|uniref:trans-aconitate 2-methyltransferase n=1 Tax=Tistrella mobilis TaxID=171437 RepID=UPI003557BF14
MTWSPARYLTFEAERTRPVVDLLAHVPTDPVRSAVDLGCGPGNSTEVLIHRFPGARVTALDSSPEMVAAARARLPDIQIAQDDVSRWQATGPFDVILSNAVLQWVPGHDVLLPALVERLAPGGSLAVQMPDNMAEPSHVLMRETAAEGPWADRLAGAARAPLPPPAWYYQLLRNLASRVDIWRTTYIHVLPGGPDAVVEWVKATGLRPFLDPLSPGERDDFLNRYRAKIAAAYPALADGTVLLPFPRLFMIATR